MVQKASEGGLGEKHGTESKETRVLGLPERIRAHLVAAGLSQRKAAQRLGVGVRPFGLWCQGRAYPPKRLWAAIIAAGICTDAELAAWRPRRPARYSLRGMRVCSLAEYAAKG